MKHQIYTAGYSGHTPQQLKVAAEKLGAIIVDIRYSPRSRVPGWSREELTNFLGAQNYRWLSSLGNRNYAGGPIQIANFSSGMVHLGRWIKERPCILLCGCADYASCHRKYLADELNRLGGWNVQEIEWPESEVGADFMRVISLWQPWASLIAIGAKRIETRGWATSYRGPIAIHAAKNTSELQECLNQPFYSVLRRARLLHYAYHDEVLRGEKAWPDREQRAFMAREILKKGGLPLPLGAIVAVADLVDCQPAGELINTITEQELAFGGYNVAGKGAGRYGWILENVRALPKPVEFRGAQGFFNVPRELLKGAI